MKGTLKLSNPILVNGKTVSELGYDTEHITGALFCEADSKRRFAAGSKKISIAPAVEFDYGMHLYLGYAACVAADPSIDFSDLERIHGTDVVNVMNIGRNFMLQSEDLPQNNSDEQSENTAEPSTQV